MSRQSKYWIEKRSAGSATIFFGCYVDVEFHKGNIIEMLVYEAVKNGVELGAPVKIEYACAEDSIGLFGICLKGCEGYSAETMPDKNGVILLEEFKIQWCE